MNRVLIVFVSLFFCFTFLCAQNTIQQNIVSQNVSGFGVFVDKELIQLIDLVKEKRYVVSLDVLEQIKEKIQQKQYQMILSFFPKEYDEWIIKKQNSVVENEFGNTDYGILFNQKYVNKQGHSIEVNIVNAAELVQDYKDFIKDPSLLKGMGNTDLIDLDGYKVIQTSYEDNKHYEKNIILSNWDIITLVANGITEKTTLDNFISSINIVGLDRYLQNGL